MSSPPKQPLPMTASNNDERPVCLLASTTYQPDNDGWPVRLLPLPMTAAANDQKPMNQPPMAKTDDTGSKAGASPALNMTVADNNKVSLHLSPLPVTTATSNVTPGHLPKDPLQTTMGSQHASHFCP